jgi:hypothetical protein
MMLGRVSRDFINLMRTEESRQIEMMNIWGVWNDFWVVSVTYLGNLGAAFIQKWKVGAGIEIVYVVFSTCENTLSLKSSSPVATTLPKNPYA